MPQGNAPGDLPGGIPKGGSVWGVPQALELGPRPRDQGPGPGNGMRDLGTGTRDGLFFLVPGRGPWYQGAVPGYQARVSLSTGVPGRVPSCKTLALVSFSPSDALCPPRLATLWEVLWSDLTGMSCMIILFTFVGKPCVASHAVASHDAHSPFCSLMS